MKFHCTGIVFSCVLFASVALCQTADFTGTWSGPFTGVKICDDGSKIQQSGTLVAELVQSGNSVSGALTGTNGPQCDGSTTEIGIFSVAATVNGSTIVFLVTTKNGSLAQATATVSGSSMACTVSSSNFAGSATLTRTSSQPPASDLSGTWSGSYSYVKVPCGALPPISLSGPLSFTILQSGSSLTGTASVAGTKSGSGDSPSNCIVTDDPPITTLFVGSFDGTTINGQVKEVGQPEGVWDPLSATVSGNTMSGSSPQEYPGESFTFTLTRSASGPPAASIINFTATPSTITAGDSATLSWSTIGATSVSIDKGVGTQPITGTVAVSPKKSTTYTLTAIGLGGTSTSTATVTVTGAGPRVVVASFPSGMLQASGESSSDSFSLANAGTDPANLTATASGGFFGVTPSSFTIQPFSNQFLTITASAQPAGPHDGTVTITGDGVPSGGIIVPVHLLVAAAPSGSVNPQPAAARVDVAAPAAQNPSGSISFTNSGSAPMNGIAVADVPWIEPQSGPITINPGESKGVSFSINRSKRPDASALFGGVTGSLSLRFLGSPVSLSSVASGTTPASSVTVSIVDVVQPALSTGTPPPLTANELALFVAAHGSAQGVSGDLLLSNRGGSPIGDLKLYYSVNNQIAALSQLASNLGVTLPSVSKTIFGVEAGGSMMLRGSLGDLTVAAIRFVNPAGSNVYGTAVPVFRSGGGVGAGGRIVLAGVEQTSTSATAVIVQELSGTATTADIQAYDANGAPIGSKSTLSLNRFASKHDAGSTVVAGAQSVVVTNTGSGWINAYARVTDLNTGDTWVITDPAALYGSSGPFVMPVLAVSGMPAQTDIYVTNTTGSPLNATMSIATQSAHRRAIRRSSSRADNSGAQQLTIKPLETQKVSVGAANGYVRISGLDGAITASGRITLKSGGLSFGSALPVVPVSEALATGDSKRFSGVSEASQKSIAASAPGTFRSSLVLLETAGSSATVHVSVWYTFPAGTLVSAQTVASKNFVVPAFQSLVIPNISRAVIGSQRDAFGDLRGMQIDVEVIDGAGNVLPFLESIENHSGDLIVRSD